MLLKYRVQSPVELVDVAECSKVSGSRAGREERKDTDLSITLHQPTHTTCSL